MRLLNRLRPRLRSWLALRRLSTADRMAADWLRKSNASNKRLAVYQVEAESLHREVTGLVASHLAELQQAIDLQKQQAEAVEALRSENKILSDVEVPFLTAANQLALERIRADIELQVRRQVAASVSKEE